jgi:hypothetical protein
MRSSFLSLIFATFFLAALAGTARAETFTAYLTGAQEVPPAATNASGYARIFVNTSTNVLSYTVVFNNLGSAQNGAHIHAPAAIGATVGVAINFGAVGGTSGTIQGTTTITPTQLSQLRAGLGYVNVHSVNFPGGEIRGQLNKARPVDNDGDGRTDYSVLRFPDIAPPGIAPITWWNLNQTSGVQVQNNWGNANTDFPAPGDYDNDGRNDLALYRSTGVVGAQNEYWILASGSNTVLYFAWGISGDQTVQRDYDGDGLTDVAVFRRGAVAAAQTTWYIRNSSTGTVTIEAFGTTGNGSTSFDTPIPGDYDGDGRFDIAVYRFGQAPLNNYIIKQSSDGLIVYRPFGNFNSDYILPGDYDGDGKYDLAVARVGATGTSPLVWWVNSSSSGVTSATRWGISADIPVQGDYDGDGRTDLSVWRTGAVGSDPAVYWIRRSFDLGQQVTPWGQSADFPVNSFDIR